MQLRKVCNHPDLFDSRDYNTSLRSLYDIVYVFPALAATVFEYNPMKNSESGSILNSIMQFITMQV